MDVQINEIQSNVRAIDRDSLLTPETLQKIINMVLAAVRDESAHGERVSAEQKITGGVTKEIERSGR